MLLFFRLTLRIHCNFGPDDVSALTLCSVSIVISVSWNDLRATAGTLESRVYNVVKLVSDKISSKYTISGHHRPTSEAPYMRRFARR